MNFLSTLSTTVASNTIFSTWTVNGTNVVTVDECESGSTIPIKSINGEFFDCSLYTLDETNKINIKKQIQLVVTSKQVIELSPLTFRPGMGYIEEVHQLIGLATIKFRNQQIGLLILEMKSKKVLKYLIKDPLPCVECIKQAMTKLTGHAGQHEKKASSQEMTKPSNDPPISNDPKQQAIATALDCMQQSKEIENLFSFYPSYELIEKMMNLNRIATESFAQYSFRNHGNIDPSHQIQYLEIVQDIQNFLLRDDVIQILDAHAKGQSLSTFSTPHKTTPSSSSDPLSSEDSTVPSTPVPTIPATIQLSHPIEEYINQHEEELYIDFETQAEREDDETDTDNKDKVKDKVKEGLVYSTSLADTSHDELHELLQSIDDEFSTILGSFVPSTRIDILDHSEQVEGADEEEVDRFEEELERLLLPSS